MSRGMNRLALLTALATALAGPSRYLRTLEDPEIPCRKRARPADAMERAEEKRQRKAAKRLKESGQ